MRPPPPDTWPPLVYDAAPPANRTSVRPSPVVLPPEAAERIVGPMNIALGHEAACAAAARHGNGGPGAAAIIGIVVGELALALAAALFVLWARRSPKPYACGPSGGKREGAMLFGFLNGSAATDQSNISTSQVRCAAFGTRPSWSAPGWPVSYVPVIADVPVVRDALSH